MTNILCGWCITNNHESHRAGGEESTGGKSWECECKKCVKIEKKSKKNTPN